MELAKRHLFTVEEYHKMGEAGVFDENARLELIEGEIVEMAPIGWRHARCVTRLTSLLARFASERALLGRRYEVSVQNPVALRRHGEPQPDLALVEGLPSGRLPGPAEIVLIVEVADTSLAYDRGRKLPLYAEAGIPEVWIVDLNEYAVEVYADPASGSYGTVSHARGGERVISPTLSDLVFDPAEVLSPEG